jgi:hypothetical protein
MKAIYQNNRRRNTVQYCSNDPPRNICSGQQAAEDLHRKKSDYIIDHGMTHGGGTANSAR